MKHLRAACAVALTGSGAQAAQVLHVSQSAVVRSVAALEQALHMVLFDRSSKGMQATPSFQQLLTRCDRAFQHLAIAPARKSSATPLQDWMRCRFALGVGERHLRVLLSLSQTASETRTAQALGVSQSAVHQTLVQAEHLSARPLFTRSRQFGLRITEFGEFVLLKCKLCLSEFEQADQVLASWSGQVRGRLVIGTLPFSTGSLLSKVVDRVMHALPGLQITVIDGTYDALMQQLRQADIDVVLGALREQFDQPGLMQEGLFVDQLAVVARSQHPLLRKKSLRWQDLRDYPWVMPMRNTPAQSVFDKTLRRAGLKPPRAELRVNSALMMQSLLLESDRLAMMSPRQIQPELAAQQMAVLPLPLTHAERKIGLVRRADLLLTPAMQHLLSACHAVAREIPSNTPDLHR